MQVLFDVLPNHDLYPRIDGKLRLDLYSHIVLQSIEIYNCKLNPKTMQRH